MKYSNAHQRGNRPRTSAIMLNRELIWSNGQGRIRLKKSTQFDKSLIRQHKWNVRILGSLKRIQLGSPDLQASSPPHLWKISRSTSCCSTSYSRNNKVQSVHLTRSQHCQNQSQRIPKYVSVTISTNYHSSKDRRAKFLEFKASKPRHREKQNTQLLARKS